MTGTSTLGDKTSQGPTAKQQSVHQPQPQTVCFAVSPTTADRSSVGHVTIDMLPDEVLLEIFYFFNAHPTDLHALHALNSTWIKLIQVCRRWRHIVFGSPRRLDLRLVCTDSTPTRRSLDIWPPIPITILNISSDPTVLGVDNLIAALEHRDRTSHIHISDINNSALEKLVAAMQEPLPILEYCVLEVDATDEPVPVLPETFLGGAAPLLQSFSLYGIPFPTFPKFILSATHITRLELFSIPTSGYISPDVMATCLSALPLLQYLSIGFRLPPYRPFQLSLPPLTCVVLPALTHLTFRGKIELIEDFVARIDTPQLDQLSIMFFMDLIAGIPRLRSFIGRTKRLKPFNHVSMEVSRWAIKMKFGSPVKLKTQHERRLSSMTQTFNRPPSLLPHVEQLDICESLWHPSEWKDDPAMDSSLWLELFHHFVAVQDLHVAEKLVPPVSATLQELTGERTMEVLPALRTLSLEGLQPFEPVEEAIKSFVASRELSGHPVVVQPWERQSSP